MPDLPTPGVCSVCGCSQEYACTGGCAWANSERTRCTRCADESQAAALAAGFARMAEILAKHGGQLGGLRLVTPVPREPTYRIHQSERPAIHCLICGAVSHHPQDVRERYCARCKRFHEE
jgi:hypothetical protein